MTDGTVVIVGASHAAVQAIDTLRREGHGGPIVLVGDEPHLPYERPPLSKGLLQGSTDLAQCSLCDSQQLAALEVEHIAANPVSRLEPQHHLLQLADGQWLSYAGLLLAYVTVIYRLAAKGMKANDQGAKQPSPPHAGIAVPAE